MLGKLGGAIAGAGLSLAASAGKGFLEGAVGKTVAGGFSSGAARARSGARGSPKTTGLTGDAGKDKTTATRDLQSDVSDQKQLLKDISNQAAGVRETLAEVGLWIHKNDLLLTKIYNKLPSQFERTVDAAVKNALMAAGVLGAGGAAAAAGAAAAKPSATPKTMPKLGGLGAIAGGLGLNYAANKASEYGYEKTSGALGTGSYALGGAGLGHMLGGKYGAMAGGAIGGLYGLYQNIGKFASDGSTNKTDFTSTKEIVFKADTITFELKSMPMGGGFGGGFGGMGFGGPAGQGFTGEGLMPGVAATGSADEAMQFFQSKGWTRAQAAAIAANIKAESNFKTNAVGDGGKAYGLAQWHPDRQRNFAKVFGKDIRQSSFQEQLAFIDWELKNTESRAGNFLRNSSTAAEAAAIVQNQYERPANKDPRYRASIAMGYAGEGGAGGGGAMGVVTTPMGTGPSGAGGSIRPQSQMGGMAYGGPAAGGMTGQNGRLDPSSLTPIGGGHRLENSAASAYMQMVDAARKDGIVWGITDSYRTYEAQVRVAQQKGLYSQGGLAAYPGRSNHGWGRALDLKIDARSSAWLQQNAGRFGFGTIPREPWHWQYGSGGGGGGAVTTPMGTGPASGGGSIRPQTAGGFGGLGDIKSAGLNLQSLFAPTNIQRQGMVVSNTGMVGGRVSPAAGNFLSTGGVDYQSNNKPLINPDGSINWGDPDVPADFARASKAFSAMKSQSGAPVAQETAKKQTKATGKGKPKAIKGKEQFGPNMPELQSLSGSYDAMGNYTGGGLPDAAPAKGEMFGPFQPLENLSGSYDAMGNYTGGGEPDAAPVKKEMFGPPMPEKQTFLEDLSGGMDMFGGGAFAAGSQPQALQQMSEDHSNYMRDQFEKQSGVNKYEAIEQPYNSGTPNKSEPAKESGPPPGEYLRDLFGDSSFNFGVGA